MQEKQMKEYMERLGLSHIMGCITQVKLENVRVVFDGSAEFDERSLNKELLTGPDLTNQITGVLLRFPQNRIVFIADLGAMYY